jgi:hypothetical protein
MARVSFPKNQELARLKLEMEDDFFSIEYKKKAAERSKVEYM